MCTRWLHTQGVIQHATINNLAFGRSVEETIRTLQAIQYVQENPDEVCPAGRGTSAAQAARTACVVVICPPGQGCAQLRAECISLA